MAMKNDGQLVAEILLAKVVFAGKEGLVLQ